MSSIIFIKLPNAEKLTIGERLRAFAKERWGEEGAIKKLAEALEMKPPSLYNYLNDDSKPGSEFLLKLNNLGCDLSWLLTGKYAKDEKEMVNVPFNYLNKLNAEKNLIPYLNKLKMRVFPIVSKISAGSMKEYFTDFDPEKTVVLPYKHDNCVALEVEGDSMANKIDNGDLVLVDLHKTVKDGDIVAVRLKSGDQFIKRFKRNNGHIILYSDNNKYLPVTLKETEIEVMRKVVKIIKDV